MGFETCNLNKLFVACENYFPKIVPSPTPPYHNLALLKLCLTLPLPYRFSWWWMEPLDRMDVLFQNLRHWWEETVPNVHEPTTSKWRQRLSGSCKWNSRMQQQNLPRFVTLHWSCYFHDQISETWTIVVYFLIRSVIVVLGYIVVIVVGVAVVLFFNNN